MKEPVRQKLGRQLPGGIVLVLYINDNYNLDKRVRHCPGHFLRYIVSCDHRHISFTLADDRTHFVSYKVFPLNKIMFKPNSKQKATRAKLRSDLPAPVEKEGTCDSCGLSAEGYLHFLCPR